MITHKERRPISLGRCFQTGAIKLRKPTKSAAMRLHGAGGIVARDYTRIWLRLKRVSAKITPDPSKTLTQHVLLVPKRGDLGAFCASRLMPANAAKPRIYWGFGECINLQCPANACQCRISLRQKLRQGTAMATYRKRGSAWQVALYVNGVRESATRQTKAEAVAWATGREAELTGKRLPDHTIGDALARFGREVTPGRKSERSELLRIAAFMRDPLAAVKLPSLTPQDLASWRDRRLKKVAAGSVRREFNVLRSALRLARVEWGWLRENICGSVKMPIAPPSRKRRIPGDQIERIGAALGLSDGLTAETIQNRIGLAFLFALETAMRAGEILGMTWTDVREKSVRLPRSLAFFC